ncbi:MAG: thioredoxin domain-containing protein [Candidatus Levybacteria bacterium]|nr:thioredoxin domain-containing protein [Candidatus Levybacteria bacterium]
MEKLTKKERKELKKQEWEEKLNKEKRSKMLKQIAVWAGAVFILIVSVWGLIQIANSPQTNPELVKLPPITSSDIAIGNPKAKAVLVEYADFQCPACAAYQPFVNQLIIDFKDNIYFVYRFFPLIQTHKNAMISAQAGFAAHKQGKFWEMDNLLYTDQKSWENASNAKEIFIDYASKLKLDMEKFQADLESDEGKKIINEQYSQGLSIGVNSTPTFFLNGVKIQNPRSYNDFKQLVQNEIDKK